MVATYHLECPPHCSFGPNTKWGPRVSDALVNGVSYSLVVAMAAKEGDTIWQGTISRHKKHIVLSPNSQEVGDKTGIRVKANNIEILETIIQKGFENSKNWKPTISDTMKAMDMWFKLTQGNPFDDLLDTLAAASLGETDVEETNPMAVRAAGEATVPDDEEEMVEAVAT